MASGNNQECSKFCLKWDGFHNNLASVFENLRQDEEFVDITLFCDGMKLKAHKMMLSAASPFFRDLLKENPCQHPVFFLRDTSCQDMAAILEFIYRGSVNVSQAQLGSFIQTAELLQIRGLSGEENGKQRESRPASADPTPATPPSAPQPPSSPRRPRAAPATPPAKRRRLSATPPPPPPEPPAPPLEAAVKREKVEEPEEVTVHESGVAAGLESMVFSPTQQQQQQQFPAAMTTSTPNMTPTANPSEEQSQGSSSSAPRGVYVCPICFQKYWSQASLHNHISMHRGTTMCPICGQTCSTTSNRNRHMVNVHGVQIGLRSGGGAAAAAVTGRDGARLGSVAAGRGDRGGFLKGEVFDAADGAGSIPESEMHSV